MIIKQNGGCSISLPQADQFEPKLHQLRAFWIYYTGLETTKGDHFSHILTFMLNDTVQCAAIKCSSLVKK